MLRKQTISACINHLVSISSGIFTNQLKILGGAFNAVVNCFQLLTIFAKSSTLDVPLSTEYASKYASEYASMQK